jgi:CBS-domain-containing membrane protein
LRNVEAISLGILSTWIQVGPLDKPRHRAPADDASASFTRAARYHCDQATFRAPAECAATRTPATRHDTLDGVSFAVDRRFLEGCMAMMAARGFRHLPVLDAGKVVGVISIGDVVKDTIRDLEHNVGS